MSGAIKATIFSNFLRHLICHYQIFFSTYSTNLIQRSETRYISKYGAYNTWKIVPKNSELGSERVCRSSWVLLLLLLLLLLIIIILLLLILLLLIVVVVLVRVNVMLSLHSPSRHIGRMEYSSTQSYLRR